MTVKYLLTCVLIMAGVTYLIRMLPLVLFHKKINNVFIQSFLYYVPYAVLAAMTFPDIFNSTSSPYSAIAGTAAALFMAGKKHGLLVVAISGVAMVYIVEMMFQIH